MAKLNLNQLDLENLEELEDDESLQGGYISRGSHKKKQREDKEFNDRKNSQSTRGQYEDGVFPEDEFPEL